MYTISTNGPSKSIISHIKYKLNEQQYIETWIPAHFRSENIYWMVRCQGPPPLPPNTWQYGRPECCRSVNARRPTSWRGSERTIKIVALPGSTSFRSFSLRPYLITICDYNVQWHSQGLPRQWSCLWLPCINVWPAPVTSTVYAFVSKVVT